jgi:hypothetical protein
MVGLLRSLRLGAVNFFGVGVPGFLILFLVTFGAIVPIAVLALYICGLDSSALTTVYAANKMEFVVSWLILSYVAGYILRLSSPDDLDEVSGRKVLAKLQRENETAWPYTGERGDKFPYFGFRKYVSARGLDHLLSHVRWGPDPDAACADEGVFEGSTKRSKTLIHIMKLEILNRQPELSAVVESNEAHVRLLSGTWIAIRSTKRLVLLGAAVSVVGALLTVVAPLQLSSADWSPSAARAQFFLLSLVSGSLIAMTRWAQLRIENQFHYRRVNELLCIVQSAHMCRGNQDPTVPSHTPAA